MNPKPWLLYPPNTSTPINPAALAGLENRVGNYVGAMGQIGPGVAQYADFAVTTPGGMVLNIGSPNVLQSAFIALDTNGSIERYEYNGPQLSLTVSTADPTNPRIDRVVLKAGVTDSQVPIPQLIVGTPTAGATLDNLTGAAAVPVGYVLLADVLVPAAAVTVAGNARDRRGISLPGSSSVIAGGDVVTPTPHPGMPASVASISAGASAFQYGYTCMLQRRIVGATRFRWKYLQGGTALLGNYNLAIYDGSGRFLAQTLSAAFAGAANSIQARADLFNGGAQTFEAGQYIVMIGLSGLSAGQVQFNGVFIGNSGTIASPPGPGMGWISSSGGTTLPNAITSAFDGSGTASFQFGGVPVVGLSVT